jgi:ABC-type polysaccharide/polyol phosphate export permease
VIVFAGVLVRYGFALFTGSPLRLADVMSVSVRAVPWAFFVSSIRFGTASLVSNSTLVTKIYFPREILPLAAVVSQLVDFAIAGALLTVVLAVAGVGVSVQLLWVPLLVALLVLLTAGVALVLAAGSLFFRDVKYLVEVILTFAIFFTPVFYEASMFQRWSALLMLNPITPLLEGLANVVVRQIPPPLPALSYSAAVALLAFVGGLRVFQRVEPYFAESV